MSNVPASRRKIAATEYVSNAAKLYSHTLDCALRLPKRWTFLLAEPAVARAEQVLHHAKAANSIWVEAPVDASLRRAHLQEAYAAAQSLSSHVDEIWRRFPARERDGKPCISEGSYLLWAEAIDREFALLKGVMRSDAERFGKHLASGESVGVERGAQLSILDL